MAYKPTNEVLLIKPTQFRYNEETAVDNAFQINSDESKSVTQQKAAEEFDNLVNTLRNSGINVMVISDNNTKDTPDSLFPNNWLSTHKSGRIMLYPMHAENRRDEVRMDVVDQLIKDYGFNKVINWTGLVEENLFLEGTGSLVIDRENLTAYCCISERSNLELAQKWALEMDTDLIAFHATDENGKAIYHTNVMMAVADEYIVICLDSINNIAEREMVIEAIESTDKEIIEISFDQMNAFAGNMIELADEKGNSIIVMSQTAYDSLDEDQIKAISKYSKIAATPIPTIEKNGGGSVRCMIAEIFPPSES